jgi:hypothetical protein
VIAIEDEWVAATSDRALWVRYPRPAFLAEVWAGFDDSPERPYRMDSRGLVEIPLREFGDVVASAGAQELVFRVRLRDKNGDEAVGQVAVYRRPVRRPVECLFCLRDEDGLSSEERAMSCSTCDFCRTYLGWVYCAARVWNERLRMRDFRRLRAGYTCSKWEGEYPGEPFSDWEELHLKGKRVCTKPVVSDNLLGAVLRCGVVTQVTAGRLFVRWDSDDHPGVWVCKFHFNTCFQIAGQA